MNLTLSRYSTARSGLLKAALIARSICDLSNPMLSKFAIADARSVPSAKADGSLKLPLPVAVAVEPVEAGVGVAGVVSDVGFGAAAGAAEGTAGVEVTACAGVDGGCAEDEAVEVLAGAIFGCLKVRSWTLVVWLRS